MLARVVIVLALSVSAAAHGAPVVLVYGDSLSAGYGLAQGTGWVDLLKQRLALRKPAYRVVNASISGETTQGGLYRIQQTLDAHRPAIVIVELGGNDGLRGLPIEATRANLEGIVEACRRHRAKVLLVGMRLPPNYGTAYTEKFHDAYTGLARRDRLPLVPFMLQGIADKRGLFQADGIHPNAAAQVVVLANIWRYLEPMLADAAHSRAKDARGRVTESR